MKKSSMKYFLVLVMLLFNVSVVCADIDNNTVDFAKKGSIKVV